jgi:hypothetical protein
MSMTLHDVASAALARGAVLTADMAGVMILEAAESIAAGGRAVEATLATTWLSEDGRVSVRGAQACEAAAMEERLRAELRRLLALAPGAAPSLRALAGRPGTGDLAGLALELEAAMIPINRSASRRALGRLYREVRRAQAAGRVGTLDELPEIDVVYETAEAPPPPASSEAPPPPASAEAPPPPASAEAPPPPASAEAPPPPAPRFHVEMTQRIPDVEVIPARLPSVSPEPADPIAPVNAADPAPDVVAIPEPTPLLGTVQLRFVPRSAPRPVPNAEPVCFPSEPGTPPMPDPVLVRPSSTTPPSQTGPAGLETGPAELETGPVELETGPVELETGPVELETGPAELETGPAGLETGPVAESVDVAPTGAYVGRRTAVADLVSRFRFRGVRSDERLVRDLKALAGLDLTPPPVAVDDEAEFGSRSDAASGPARGDRAKASSVTRPQVLGACLFLAMGVLVLAPKESRTPGASSEPSECQAVVEFASVDPGVEVRIRELGVGESWRARVSDGSVVEVGGLRCGRDHEAVLRRADRWERIVVRGVELEGTPAPRHRIAAP